LNLEKRKAKVFASRTGGPDLRKSINGGKKRENRLHSSWLGRSGGRKVPFLIVRRGEGGTAGPLV